MKVLVFGASGQLGSFLLDELASQNVEAVGVYSNESSYKAGGAICDIRSLECVQNTIAEVNPTTIFNFAGISNPAECENDKQRAYDVNVLGVRNILTAIRDTSIRFVNIGSTNELVSTGFYSSTKRVARTHVESHREAGSNCSQFYVGLNDSERRTENTFSREVINQISKALNGEEIVPVEIYDVDTPRHWGYSKDFAKAIWNAHDVAGNVAILGGLHTKREFVELALESLPFTFRKTKSKYLVYDGKREYTIFTVNNNKNTVTDASINFKDFQLVNLTTATPFWRMVDEMVRPILKN